MSSPAGPERVAFESGGETCEADLYRPASADPPWPAVVLANVFGAPRTWGLDRFARQFASAGIAAMPFDYRGFGTSEGTPRRLVDPGRQLADWRAAIDHVRSLDDVDAARVAAWGSSFSGGNALLVARDDPTVRAVVAMVPFVDGRAVMAHQTAHLGPIERARTFGLALADRLLGTVGLGPMELPIVSEPHEGGLVDTPGAMEGFLELVPDGATVVNRMPARVVLDLPFHRPGVEAKGVDVPVQIVIGEEDRLLPIGPMERLAERLPDATVHRVPAGHFGPQTEPWVGEVVERQVTFLTDALAVEG
ncbi:MAG: alpha/beta hydrolase [Halobacteriales archaeon]|nr:alpha/beta hydrolase [Halobacteriales archaeon]